jgi:hypothetical protein
MLDPCVTRFPQTLFRTILLCECRIVAASFPAGTSSDNLLPSCAEGRS